MWQAMSMGFGPLLNGDGEFVGTVSGVVLWTRPSILAFWPLAYGPTAPAEPLRPLPLVAAASATATGAASLVVAGASSLRRLRRSCAHRLCFNRNHNVLRSISLSLSLWPADLVRLLPFMKKKTVQLHTHTDTHTHTHTHPKTVPPITYSNIIRRSFQNGVSEVEPTAVSCGVRR